MTKQMIDVGLAFAGEVKPGWNEIASSGMQRERRLITRMNAGSVVAIEVQAPIRGSEVVMSPTGTQPHGPYASEGDLQTVVKIVFGST
jgi:hypothetical protein